MKLHSWGQIEAGGQCESQSGEAPSLGVLMEQLDAEMEALQELAEESEEVETHDHSEHDHQDHAASSISHEEFHAQNPNIENESSQIHEAFHQMENMHNELHQIDSCKIESARFLNGKILFSLFQTISTGASSETAPDLHNQFHEQSNNAMGAMNGMIMQRSGFNPDSMNPIDQMRSIQDMAQMQQQLQQSIMQMQQMMYQYNTILNNQQTPNMRAIQGPYTCKSCKQALQLQQQMSLPTGVTGQPMAPLGGFAQIVNPIGLPPVSMPETPKDAEFSRERREVTEEKPKGDIWSRLHSMN